MLPAAVFAAILALVLAAGSASAANGVVNFFGDSGTQGGQFSNASSGPGGVAVNQEGTGGATAGDVYVVDRGNNRIQQFTAAGAFVRAFGLNVGGAGVHVCTVAASCVVGSASAEAGGLSAPQGIAIDQATGNVYVTDQNNRRVAAYSATGTFQAAFGYGVDTGAAALELCTTASTCQAGSSGANAGQFGAQIGYPAVAPAGSPNAGHVYLADKSNRRVDQFEPTLTAGEVTGISFIRGWGWGVDTGASEFQQCTTASVCQAPNTSSPTSNPGQFGSNQPQALAIDSSGNVYVAESAGNNRAQKFDASGNPVAFSALELNGSPGPIDIAVDKTNSRVYALKEVSGTGEKRVLEFNSSGAFLATHASGTTITSASGLAVAQGTTNFYVSANQSAAFRGVVFLGTKVNPTATVEAPSPLASHSATLKGKVNPKGFSTSYRFEFSADEGSTWTKIPATDVNLGNGTSDVAVEQSVSGLVGGHEYQYRIVATKPFGAGTATSSQETFTTPAAAPQLIATFSSAVTSTAAVLQAQINPNNQATTYHFEYGTADCASNPCTSIPVPDAGIGSGGAPVTVAKEVTGLQAGTDYHYRVVASNATGTTAGPDTTFSTYTPFTYDTNCPNQEFRTGPSASLPDCRAYEMVSPVDKNGADVGIAGAQTFSDIGLNQSALSGDKFTYTSAGSFANQLSSANANQYIATRGPDGWVSDGINPPMEKTVFDVYDIPYMIDLPFLGFTEDLSHAWVLNANKIPLTPDAITGFGNLYRRDNSSGSFEAVTAGPPPTFYGGFDNHKGMELEFRGASADLEHQAFDARAGLTVDAASAAASSEVPRQAYDYSDGELHLVSVYPSGTAALEGAYVGSTPLERFGTAENSRLAQVQGAVSEDGSRIVWSSSFRDGQRRIYVRENPAEPQSSQLHGGATGFGKVTSGSTEVTSLTAAAGRGVFTSGSPLVTGVETLEVSGIEGGTFVAGQPVSAPGTVPPGTTVISAERESFGKFKLTLSASAEASGGGVLIRSDGPAPFAVGQAIAGQGIAPGTTITAVAPGVLTLSAPGTQTTASNNVLVASSECTEPDKACTIPVSDTVSSGSADFWGASTDGSKIIFSVRTDPGTGGRGQGDLYEFDVDTGTPTLIALKTRGVLGTSRNLSHVYFVSTANLAAGAVAGANNVYLAHNGDFSLVATLSTDDIIPASFIFASSPASPSPFQRSSRVTPDGRNLAFASDSAALAMATAGYDNTDAVTGERAQEVYVYGVDTGLECASCNPSGARPTGRPAISPHGGHRVFDPPRRAAAWLPTSGNESHAERLLSADGGRLFFNSYDALVPQDTNGQQDVYQWEALGTGGCDEAAAGFSARNGGCVSLISTGESDAESEFLDASASGDTVFFLTESSIDPRDTGLVDVYAARVGGGYPPPASGLGCLGDSCQSPSAPPNDATPASAGFRGAGNATPQRKARRGCRARGRHAGKAGKAKQRTAKRAKQKKAKRCKRAKRGAAR